MRLSAASGSVAVRVSTRTDGDFHLDRVDPAELATRQQALVPGAWSMLDEVHGTEVVTVDQAGGGNRVRGDIALVTVADAVVGIWAGDCAPIVVVGREAGFAAVHAGWRGVVAGVIDRAVVSLHGGVRHAWLGPSIRACCYEFGPSDAAAVAAAVSVDPDTIGGTTSWGAQSLDLPAALRAAFASHGVDMVEHGACTGCHPDFFSHRMGPDPERHVVASWWEPGAT